MTRPILADEFYHDGRGPALQRLHWRGNGTVLVAADYYNPDASHTAEQLRHIRFLGPQVVLVTPEEVVHYERLGLGEALIRFQPAAAIDQGRSPWLQSFAPTHLERCRHFQLMFYDELLEVVCEDVESHTGGYVPE